LKDEQVYSLSVESPFLTSSRIKCTKPLWLCSRKRGFRDSMSFYHRKSCLKSGFKPWDDGIPRDSELNLPSSVVVSSAVTLGSTLLYYMYDARMVSIKRISRPGGWLHFIALPITPAPRGLRWETSRRDVKSARKGAARVVVQYPKRATFGLPESCWLWKTFRWISDTSPAFGYNRNSSRKLIEKFWTMADMVDPTTPWYPATEINSGP